MFGTLLGRLILLSILVTLVGCSKGPGFRAENLDYEIAIPEKPVISENKDVHKPGTVVRNAEKIKFKPSQTKWSSNNTQLTLKANVTLNGRDLGEVEFEGKKEDSKIVLVPKDDALKKTVVAQVQCLSEDDSCTDHFIDVIYQENKVIYVQQVLPVEKNSVIVKPEDPAKPADPKKPQDPKSPSKDPAKDKEKEQEQEKEKQQDKYESFDDIIDVENTAKSTFQGVSDERAQLLIRYEAPTKEPEVPAQKPPAPPQNPAPPPGKPPGPTPVPNPQPSPQPVPPTPKPPEPKNPETPVSENPVFQQLEKFRAYNQSFNFPQTVVEKRTRLDGSIVNVTLIGRVNKATDFVEVSKIPGIGFLFTPGKTSIYGAFNLASVLAKMGEFMKEILPNKPLHVNSIGLFNGGIRPPGVSHQNGNDADIRYIRVKDDFEITRDVVEGNRVTNNFMVKEQWQLIKKTFLTGEVELIAVDGVIKKALCDYAKSVSDYKPGQDDTQVARMLKRILPTEGHEDHFHVRVRCGVKNEACRTIQYRDYPVGC